MTTGAPNIPLQLVGICWIGVFLTDEDLAVAAALAHDEGLTAAQAGEDMAACPYVVGSPECAAWLRGWDAGRPRRPRNWRDL